MQLTYEELRSPFVEGDTRGRVQGLAIARIRHGIVIRGKVVSISVGT